MSTIAIPKAGTALYDYPKYWAECYGTAEFLPVSRAEMDALGWDSCDIIIVTGDVSGNKLNTTARKPLGC